jgi:hypothetical protein
MKLHYTKRDYHIGVICLAITLASIGYFLSTPAKTDYECSVDYVKINGSQDCELKSKANERESDTIRDSQLQ